MCYGIPLFCVTGIHSNICHQSATSRRSDHPKSARTHDIHRNVNSHYHLPFIIDFSSSNIAGSTCDEWMHAGCLTRARGGRRKTSSPHRSNLLIRWRRSVGRGSTPNMLARRVDRWDEEGIPKGGFFDRHVPTKKQKPKTTMVQVLFLIDCWMQPEKGKS